MLTVNQALTAQINWNRYPTVNTLPTNREKAYLILHIVKNELGKDNLSASEISDILSKKFRKKITNQAIRGALNPKIGDEVDTIHREDGTIAYTLLSKGIKNIGLDAFVVNEDFSANQIVIPIEIASKSKDYIKKIVFQINGCYRDGYFDACAVMIRRLFETFIIEIYEYKNINNNIKDDNNNYLSLSKLIKKITNEKEINLSSQTKGHLDKIKLFGDTGAHSRKINLKKVDIDAQKEYIRLSAEELISELCSKN